MVLTRMKNISIENIFKFTNVEESILKDSIHEDKKSLLCDSHFPERENLQIQLCAKVLSTIEFGACF